MFLATQYPFNKNQVGHNTIFPPSQSMSNRCSEAPSIENSILELLQCTSSKQPSTPFDSPKGGGVTGEA